MYHMNRTILMVFFNSFSASGKEISAANPVVVVVSFRRRGVCMFHKRVKPNPPGNEDV